MLCRRQHDAGHLLGLGLGQQAVDFVVVSDVAAVRQQQQAETPATAVQRHEALLALPARPHDRRDHHAGGQDGVCELGHAVVGGLLETKVLRRKAKVAEADLDGGHRGGRHGRNGVGVSVGHRGQAPAPGRGSSCPFGAPRSALPPSFVSAEPLSSPPLRPPQANKTSARPSPYRSGSRRSRADPAHGRSADPYC